MYNKSQYDSLIANIYMYTYLISGYHFIPFVEYLDSNFIRTMLDYVRLNFFCYMIFKGLCLVNSHNFQALIGLKLKCAFSYSEVQSTNLVWIFRPEIEPRFFGLVLLIGYPKT